MNNGISLQRDSNYPTLLGLVVGQISEKVRYLEGCLDGHKENANNVQ